MVSKVKVDVLETVSGSGNLVVNQPLSGSGANLTNLPAHTGTVAFPATQVASADANTFDDYEEGTWDPNLYDGKSGATHASNNLGRYTKIGNLCFISCTVSTSGLGSVSGSLKVRWLPFTSSNTQPNLGMACTAGSGGGMALTAGYNMSGNFNANTSEMALYTWDVSTGTSAMQHSEWGGGNTQMTFFGHYFV